MSDLKSAVPPLRLRSLNHRNVRPDGDYVLYWMTAYRRTRSNFALQRACEWARHLDVPLVILSALRLGYRWASERSHAFILDSMADVAAAAATTRAVVYTHLETEEGSGKGLVAALAGRAAVIVVDDAPIFFLPAATAAAAVQVDVLMEGVDHNGLMPLASTDRVFNRAYDLRRYLQAGLAPHLDEFPEDDPLSSLPPAPPSLLEEIRERWPSPDPDRRAMAHLHLETGVPTVAMPGGQQEALRRLARFIEVGLGRYDMRSHPDEEVTSGLSPYLHFGNVSPHQVFAAVSVAERWDPGRLGDGVSGARSGWWGMSKPAEGFLDQMVTWRELGYRAARYVPDNGSYSALPNWARVTLEQHAADQRESLYTIDDLEAAETHDELWNAAQQQLRDEGTIHNYMRMLWGKKILEWTAHPEHAHDIMFELNNRYALDGRDPNSVSGIHWVMGRYDRPWGPEREIFGTVRYMSSSSARRKLRMQRYLSGQSEMLST
jgi:deoxyribodipyrimidine photo-lyase